MRRTCLSLAILFAAATAVGCPAPTASDQQAKSPATNPGPANAPSAGGKPGAAAGRPAQAGDAPPPAGPGAAPPEGAPPKDNQEVKELSFARLIGEGQSISIKVKINGAETGQVDFFTIGGEHDFELLHIEKFENSAMNVKAPATYAQPIYVQAISLAAGENPGPDSAVGVLKDPIKLAGEDLELEITIGENTDVLKELMPEAPEGAPPPPPPYEPDENAL